MMCGDHSIHEELAFNFESYIRVLRERGGSFRTEVR